MIVRETVYVPVPLLEVMSMGQVYEPGVKPAVSIFTVIVSCSPVESPLVGVTVTQLLVSLRL